MINNISKVKDLIDTLMGVCEQLGEEVVKNNDGMYPCLESFEDGTEFEDDYDEGVVELAREKERALDALYAALGIG